MLYLFKNSILLKLLCVWGKAGVCFMAFDKNLNTLHFHKTFLYDKKYLF